jgi:hypothetical protein
MKRSEAQQSALPNNFLIKTGLLPKENDHYDKRKKTTHPAVNFFDACYGCEFARLF